MNRTPESNYQIELPDPWEGIYIFKNEDRIKDWFYLSIYKNTKKTQIVEFLEFQYSKYEKDPQEFLAFIEEAIDPINIKGWNYFDRISDNINRNNPTIIEWIQHKKVPVVKKSDLSYTEIALIYQYDKQPLTLKIAPAVLREFYGNKKIAKSGPKKLRDIYNSLNTPINRINGEKSADNLTRILPFIRPESMAEVLNELKLAKESKHREARFDKD